MQSGRWSSSSLRAALTKAIWLCAVLYGARAVAQGDLFDDFGDREARDCDPVCWDYYTSGDPPGSCDASTGNLVLSGVGTNAILSVFGNGISIRTRVRFNGGELGQLRLQANLGEGKGYRGQLNKPNGKLALWNDGGAGSSKAQLCPAAYLDASPSAGEELVMQLDVHLEADEVVFRVWRPADGPDRAVELRGTDGVHRSGKSGVAVWSPGGEGATFRYVWISHERIVGEPPRAAFSWTCGEDEETVVLDASESSPSTGHEIESWEWRLGDGEEDAGEMVEHRYGDPGAYTVQLRIQDSRGLVSVTDRTIEIPCWEPEDPIAFRRGDSNADGAADLSDAVFTLLHLFSGGEAPACLDAADSDDSGSLDISDPVYLLNYLFVGGPPPANPFPECGPDPTPDDDLGCASYGRCQEPRGV